MMGTKTLEVCGPVFFLCGLLKLVVTCGFVEIGWKVYFMDVLESFTLNFVDNRDFWGDRGKVRAILLILRCFFG